MIHNRRTISVIINHNFLCIYSI